MDSELKQLKSRLRAVARERRAAAAAEMPDAGERLAGQLLGAVPLEPGWAVSGYWPMGDELDLRPLLRRLAGRGHPIGLPVIVARGEALLFRRWHPGDVLEPAGFGTSVPGPGSPEIVPRVLLVPLLAFDRAGWRLGYGGGFYDRTLAKLRRAGPALAVGVGFAGQEVAFVPHHGGDERLDRIVTEREAIDVADAG